jgi:hypothetical protein
MDTSNRKRSSKSATTESSLSMIGRRPPEARELEEAVLGADAGKGRLFYCQ